MNMKKIVDVLTNKVISKGDDWTLAELEEGIILLQRKSNKAKGHFTNLKSR